MKEIEPFYGWLHLYNHEMDERSPFHGVEHSEFYYDKQIYDMPAHPQWDEIGSESLLVKILFADYDQGYAIIELFGEWNDLYDNDFKLMCEYCLNWQVDEGINKFILICENVFNVWVEGDDYYEAFQDDLGEGWIAILRGRPHVLKEFEHYGLSQYLYWAPGMDELLWRKLKPPQIYRFIEAGMGKMIC